MALPEKIRKQVTEILPAYCAARCPANFKDEVRLGFMFRGNSVTLFEERPAFLIPGKWVEIVVAQFRYDHKSRLWMLYAADRNSRWFRYWEIEPSRDFSDLLGEVEADPTGIFWG